jgi:anti-sigma-K factor RskA
MTEQPHDLVAPYALDALDSDERHSFERHLEECAECRAQLAELQVATGALASSESLEPPPGLRARILDAARAENGGGRVVEFPRRRWVLPATAGAAAAAALVAVGVGLWATSLSRDLDRERSVKESYAQAIQLLDDGAQVTRLANAEGGLLVTPGGKAALVVCGLQPAPKGKTYEAWVIEGEVPRPAGLFSGGSGCPPVLLEREVPPGSQVAVTLERSGGAAQPTGALLVRSDAV